MRKIISLLLLLCILLSACGQQTTIDLQPSTATEASENNDHTTGIGQKQVQKSLDGQADDQAASPVQTEPDEYDYVLEFPSDSYPETALHIYSAIENGHSDVCTIDRDGADERRKQSLKGISTREGYDRDEWPMAMCAEGGEGASVAYVNSSDNRGAGSWVGHQLSAYEDGEKVLFIVTKPKNLFGGSDDSELKLDEDLLTSEKDKQAADIVYKNCSEAHAAGVTPLYEGDPGYSKKLDRDGDGVACEL
ncbi:hypothetical protein J40TS1_05790 [Paenibacillus montaniterrae]|uniref:Excalibur calcium-binding domain-containing protein n=1 Tax=Paenibacillus montaniterrae TaxID=429341 RepID=A0A919YKG3_9BACL|nr:hypothetical protein J40TS1_05790 [Paenibacillus montaniterrae]